MLLVTGAAGLIGRHFCARLTEAGVDYRPFDLRLHPLQDVRSQLSLVEALRDVEGVVHLAAVSRVIWGERDPNACFATNVHALANFLTLCTTYVRPWFIFASSREVYGAPLRLPVCEDAPLLPLNHYGRSKMIGEKLTQDARKDGLITNMCRFSNVFGCSQDHPDRVAMAFAHAAAQGGTIEVEGATNTFEFTFVKDVVEGLLGLVNATAGGELLPPIHFVSGTGTTLGQLATMAVEFGQKDVSVVERPPRSFDVAHFIGDPTRAKALLGWVSTFDLRQEFHKLISTVAADVGYTLRTSFDGTPVGQRIKIHGT